MNKKVMILAATVLAVIVLILVGAFAFNGTAEIKDGNLNELSKHLDAFYDVEKIDKESLGYALNQNIYINIEEIKCNSDNTGKAKVVVTAPDLENTLKNCISAIKDIENKEVTDLKELIESNMFNTLNSGDYEKVQTTLEVDIQKIDGTWKFLYNDEFGKAITCNMRELYRNAIKEMLKGE